MSGMVELFAYDDKDELLVTVHDYDTGSDTSFGADNKAEAYERALIWLGYDILTPRTY